MLSWTRRDDRSFTAMAESADGEWFRLSLERLTDADWDWAVWREDDPDLCRYGLAPGSAHGFAAAERALACLVRTRQAAKSGGAAPSGVEGRA